MSPKLNFAFRKSTKAGQWDVLHEGVDIGYVFRDEVGWWHTQYPTDPQRYWTRGAAAESLYGQRSKRESNGFKKQEHRPPTEMEVLIAKIRKLLETKGRTPEEAAAFAAKAQDLMTRYNLTEGQLQSAKVEDFVSETVDIGYRENWRKLLVFAIARTNFCRAVYYEGTKVMGVVGEPHNIKMVDYLYGYLANEIARLADLAWEERRFWVGGRSDARPWKASFCKGATEVIERRLEEQRRESEATIPNARALVVVKDQQVLAAFRRFHPNTRSGNFSSPISFSSGLRAGREAGEKISINKPIDSSETDVLRLR